MHALSSEPLNCYISLVSRHPIIIGSRVLLTAIPSAIVATQAYAVQYMTIEEAQQEMFPHSKEFISVSNSLTHQQKATIEKQLDFEFDASRIKFWSVLNNDGSTGFFAVDQVIGKHELITYAVAVSSDLKVISINVLEYLENYGAEIRQPEWRAQFKNKTTQDPLTLGEDIQNISGATFSCRHITEGVKKILLTLSQMSPNGK